MRGNMTKIGILSDTHDVLRDEVLDALQGCNLILHGGDVGREEILTGLGRIAEVRTVKGNNDEDWGDRLPETLRFSYAGLQFYMIHDREEIKDDLSGVQIVVHGHSHLYEEKEEGGRLWLNPGSCGPKRFILPVTLAILEVEEDASYRVKKVEIPVKFRFGFSARRAEASEKKLKTLSELDKRQLVSAVMKETNRGKSPASIAAKCGISPELAEHICRLYLTHPGIDADGILNKLELGRR